MSKKQKKEYDAKEEFLEYLNKNDMGYIEIFCKEKSQYSFFETQLIHSSSELMGKLINKMSEVRGITPEIHVFCTQEEMVDAFCFVTNQHYYIGIHSATYVELIRRAQRLADYLTKSEKWIYYKNKQVGEIQALLWTYALKMILAHEYMHVILGHCDTICPNRAYLWENDSNRREEVTSVLAENELQAIEMLADEFAAMDAAWLMIADEHNVEDIKYKLLNYYLAVLLVFSIFHNYQEEVRNHPRLGIRLHSIISTVDDTLMKGLEVPEPEAEVEKIDAVIDIFMEIVQQYPELFSYEIVTDLGMEDFDREYARLYNAAADIVKITNRQAIYPIYEFEKVDESTLELLGKEKEILWYATQNGMNYEEACELIRKMKQ